MAEKETEQEKTKRERKSVARNTDVVVGCIEERFSMLTGNEEHVIRLGDLMDELRRSLAKKGAGE